MIKAKDKSPHFSAWAKPLRGSHFDIIMPVLLPLDERSGKYVAFSAVSCTLISGTLEETLRSTPPNEPPRKPLSLCRQGSACSSSFSAPLPAGARGPSDPFCRECWCAHALQNNFSSQVFPLSLYTPLPLAPSGHFVPLSASCHNSHVLTTLI